MFTLRINLSSPLAQHINAVDASVTTLDLSHNLLNQVPTEDLIKAFSALKPNVSHLILNFTKLVRIANQGNLRQVLSALPETVKELSVQNNFLCFVDEPHIDIFTDLPKTVVKLNLGSNELGETLCSKLIKMLSNIPEGVKVLDLSGNQLSRFSLEDLTLIFNSCPSTVKTLVLRNNGFYHSDADEKKKGAGSDVSPELLNVLSRTGRNIIIEKPISDQLRERARLPILLALRDATQSLDDKKTKPSTSIHAFFNSPVLKDNPQAVENVVSEVFSFLPRHNT